MDHVIKQPKGILNTLKAVDPWFWCRYTLNPYNGCEHACIYCDARSQKYHMQEGFDEVIVVKADPHVILEYTLKRGRGLIPDVVGFGGACDAYQPAEKTYQNSRRLLEVLERHKFPVFLLTKSDLVLRDLDVVAGIARSSSWATLAFTITTLDPAVARVLEPGAPPPAARLDALQQAARDKVPGMQAGTVVMPFLPCPGDPRVSIRDIVRETRDAGGEFVLFSPGVSLRDRQETHFLARLQAAMTDVHDRFVATYVRDPSWRARWVRDMNACFKDACKDAGIAYRVRRFIPKDDRKWNYRVAERLLGLAYECQLAGEKGADYHAAGVQVQGLPVSIAGPARDRVLRGVQGLSPRARAVIDAMLPRAPTGLDKYA